MNIKGIERTAPAIGRILRSNRIHFAGFILAGYIGMIFHWIVEEGTPFSVLPKVLLYSWLYSFMLVLLYGWKFLIGFYVSIILLDAVLFAVLDRKHTALILSAEWILLSSLPVVWSFEHRYPFWLLLVVSFAITQTVRYFRIGNIGGEGSLKGKRQNSKREGTVRFLPF